MPSPKAPEKRPRKRSPEQRPSRRRKRASNAVDRLLANVADFVGRAANKAELARRADLDEKSIRQAERPGWNPRAETLARLVGLLPGDWTAGDALPADLAGDGPATSGSAKGAARGAARAEARANA